MEFKKLSIALLGILIAIGSVPAQATSQPMIRTANYVMGSLFGFGAASSVFLASCIPTDKNSSYFQNYFLKNNKPSFSRLKSWYNNKQKEGINIPAVVAPPLVGWTAALLTRGHYKPTAIGAISGALYCQMLIDAPIIGNEPVRKDLQPLVGNQIKRAMLSYELKKQK